MASGFRPLYDDDAQLIIPDWSASSASAYVHGIGLSASKVLPVYTGTFMIIYDNTISAQAANSVTYVDVNYSSIYAFSPTGTQTSPYLKYATNRLLNQPSYNNVPRKMPIYNPSFSANWTSLTSIAAGAQFVRVLDTPVRWLRLRGAAVSANFAAYFFSDTNTQGT
jgi:hypothetical protein